MRVRLVALFVVWIISACASPETRSLEPSLLYQDYYFSGDSVQIQGNAAIGPVRTTESETTPPGNSEKGTAPGAGTEKKTHTYRTLTERRDECRKRAVQNSHSKWMMLTSKDPQDQAEWDLRLRLGARGPWSHCLEHSQVLGTFFEKPGACRVVVFYRCLPQEY